MDEALLHTSKKDLVVLQQLRLRGLNGAEFQTARRDTAVGGYGD